MTYRIHLISLIIFITITTIASSGSAQIAEEQPADDHQELSQDVREEIYESWRIYPSRLGSSSRLSFPLLSPSLYFQGSMNNSLSPTQLYRELDRPGHARMAFRIPRWISVPLAIAMPFATGGAAAWLTASAFEAGEAPPNVASGLLALSAGTLGFGAGVGISWLITRDFHPVRSATRNQWIDEYNRDLRYDLGLE